ncbi:putative sporulation-specific N-formyltyrosine oxidase Dit2 [Aspergillus egyptiacus]|nr:putative sporulation-specific N-formyltyrosine oxidase Dit2 [Aspergillus egyptiacus]
MSSLGPPRGFPRNIPVIPLWLHVYDIIVRGASRAEFYNARIRQPIQRHGAVVLWHEGQWSILATRPDYVAQVFKNGDRALIKNGFYHRVPWGSGAQLFGENIIDSDGELHAEFSKILKPGILRKTSIAFIKTASRQLAGQLAQAQMPTPGVGVAIGAPVWHWAVAVFGHYFMDTQIGPLDYGQTSIQQIIGHQNSDWLGRLKGLSPVLDRLPRKLPIYQRAFTLFQNLEATLLDLVESRKGIPPSPGNADQAIYLLNQAREQGHMSDFHYRSNIKQLFAAGHGNVETVLVSAMSELAKHPHIQGLLRDELTQLLPTDYSAEDLGRLPLLNAVIYETLRLFPPLGTLINRRTTEPFRLGSDILIPAGVLVGWHSYGSHTDPGVWGESASRFDPFRWGTDCETINQRVRAKQARGIYFPFGIYSRKCLGRAFALTQLRVALCELTKNLEWGLPQGYKFSYSKAAVMAPNNCTLLIRQRKPSPPGIEERKEDGTGNRANNLMEKLVESAEMTTN